MLRLWLVLSLFSFQVAGMTSDKMLKLASFNIRFGGPERPTESRNFDQERPWHKRRDGLVDQVIWEEPDIIGFQEVGNLSRLFVAERVIIFAWQVLDNQLHDLAYLLEPSYLHVGVGRDDGKTAGEAVPIFWRKWIHTR
jgi:hypothetical protein